MQRLSSPRLFGLAGLSSVLLGSAALLLAGASASAEPAAAGFTTRTPIKHVVVIYQENISFDHYFATYPKAENKPEEPKFVAKAGTPSVNGLSGALLTNNPNGVNPVRLDRSAAVTCDMDHDYGPEQNAYNGGLLNRFVEFSGSKKAGCDPKTVMGYYDGNTVTAWWNYAQNFALSDNFFNTQYGPSTPGVLNLVAGSTGGAIGGDIPGLVRSGWIISDADPALDECSGGKNKLTIKDRKHVGDQLNAKGVTWGWFQGGFKPSETRADGSIVCGATTANAAGKLVRDYSPHHNPFQYYEHSANPKHLPPSSPEMIGKVDQAKNQYDLTDFWTAVEGGNMPAVVFLKAPAAQDGHAGYSGPLDEQKFLVETINRLQQRPEWASMAIMVAYDDSDGWYDHVMPPLVRASTFPEDALSGPGKCGAGGTATSISTGPCGYGPRLPFLVVSPYARENFVDSSLADQSSILRFIQDNWSLGRLGGESMDTYAGSIESMFDFEAKPRLTPVLLDPQTGLAR